MNNEEKILSLLVAIQAEQKEMKKELNTRFKNIEEKFNTRFESIEEKFNARFESIYAQNFIIISFRCQLLHHLFFLGALPQTPQGE